MIEFKIIQTPDKGQIGAYQHFQNEIVMGNGGGDMIVDDPDLGAQQVHIHPDGSGFVIENLNPDVEVRVSGKTVEEKLPIKNNDTVNMGKTTIHFLLLSQETPQPPEPFTHPQTANRVVEGSREKAILDALEYLAEGGHEAESPTPAVPTSKPPMPPRPAGGMPPLPPPLPGKK